MNKTDPRLSDRMSCPLFLLKELVCHTRDIDKRWDLG